jgi:predicted acylesterase/phospholipase RssA
MTNKKNCYLTLGAGVAYSAYHIGVIQRILQQGYTPKVVSATGTGTVLALLCLLEKFDVLEEIYSEFCSIKNTIRNNDSLLFKLVKTILLGETFSSNKLESILKSFFTKEDFDRLQERDIEFIVETTNIFRFTRHSFNSKKFSSDNNWSVNTITFDQIRALQEKNWINYEKFIKRIIISSSIPFISEPHGIFNPVINQMEWFVDGFVSDGLPVASVYEKRRPALPHFIIACNPQVKIENNSIRPRFLQLTKQTIGHLFYTSEMTKIKRGFQTHWDRSRFFVIKNKNTFFENAIDPNPIGYREAIKNGFIDADKFFSSTQIK